MIQQDTIAIREAVAVFCTVGDLEAAVDELLSSGFDRAELSLLASASAVDEKIGRLPRRDVEDNPNAPRTAYVSPAAIGAAEGGLIGSLAYLGSVSTAGAIAIAGGPLTLIALGALAAGGAGSLIGTAFAALLGQHRAAYYEEQLFRGGLLLWVRTWSPDRECRAVEILKRHSGRDVHVHGSVEHFGKAVAGRNRSVGHSV